MQGSTLLDFPRNNKICGYMPRKGVNMAKWLIKIAIALLVMIATLQIAL